MLADFANVAAQDPELGRASTPPTSASTPTSRPCRASRTSRDAFEAGYFNKDFASAKYDDGIKAVATGTAAHYPMLTSAIAAINAELSRTTSTTSASSPCRPRTPANTRMTVWLPNAALHPEDDRGRQAGGGQEVRRLRQLPGGLRDPEHGRAP